MFAGFKWSATKALFRELVSAKQKPGVCGIGLRNVMGTLLKHDGTRMVIPIDNNPNNVNVNANVPERSRQRAFNYRLWQHEQRASAIAKFVGALRILAETFRTDSELFSTAAPSSSSGRPRNAAAQVCSSFEFF